MNLITLARNLNRIEAYLNKQEAVLSAQAPEWFKKMTKEEQKAYLKEHPGSKLKPGGGGSSKQIKTNKKKTANKEYTVYSPNTYKSIVKELENNLAALDIERDEAKANGYEQEFEEIGIEMDRLYDKLEKIKSEYKKHRK